MYNYKEAIKADIKEAITEYNHEGMNRDELEETLKDELWTDDSVTGNGSGSYTFSRELAKEYVTDDGAGYLKDAATEFCIPSEKITEAFLTEDYEYFDVTIRCYLLNQCITEVLDEMEEENFFKENGICE